MNLYYNLGIVRIIRNHQDTWILLGTRLLQVGLHHGHLHLHGFSRFNLALLQIHLQAHGKHLHASDFERRLTVVGNQHLALQFLLAAEAAQVEVGG